MTFKFVYAAAITVMAFAPISAAAHDNGYNHRHQSNGDQQLVGGVIGAIAGGVIGSQVAGSGARTEGSVLGAVIGGVAGAAIAGSDNRSQTYGGTTHYNTGYNGGYYRQPTYTTTYQTQPTYYQPQPTYYQPRPTYYQPQPTYYQPRPTYYHTTPTYSYAQPYYPPRTGVSVTIGSTGHYGYQRPRNTHYRAHTRSNRRTHHGHSRRYGH